VSGAARTLRALGPLLLDAEAAAALEVPAPRRAAVLVPLRRGRAEPHIVFTERHHALSHHAGEISFPGGRVDAADASPIAAALREAQEEVGLPGEAVEVIGALRPLPTLASGFGIYPFVGVVAAGVRWRPNRQEVAAVIEVPLSELAAGYGRRRISRSGFAMRTDTYLVGGHTIWGATARIVADLLERLEASAGQPGTAVGGGDGGGRVGGGAA